MEMKETVERMVMVRTTGSDLQPAATGYIYKKESDGAASVIKMGESEVMEHLSKVYEQPKSFTAPIPVATGPFYGKEDEDKAASFSSESKVIPVVDIQDEQIDGIANENIFGEYASDFGIYNSDSDFDEYLKSLGYFEDGIYHEHEDGKEYGAQQRKETGDKERKGYGTKDNFKNGGTGDYHSEKYETYRASGESGGHKDYDDARSLGKYYANGHEYKGDDQGYQTGKSQGEALDGFHKLFDKKEFKKDHDFHDGEALKGGFHKFAGGRDYYGSDDGKFTKGDLHDSGRDEAYFGKDDFHDKLADNEYDRGHITQNGGKSFQHFHGDFAATGGKNNDKSYGYEIKHR